MLNVLPVPVTCLEVAGPVQTDTPSPRVTAESGGLRKTTADQKAALPLLGRPPGASVSALGIPVREGARKQILRQEFKSKSFIWEDTQKPQ